MAQVKTEEIAPHPPMDQLQGFEYFASTRIRLGHYILALGAAVMIPTLLVPLMGGNDGDKARVVQTWLFVTGINTLIQTLFGTRLPTVIGGSYAFVIPIISIIRGSSLKQITDDHERFLQTMRAILSLLGWEIGVPMLILFVASSQLPVLERFSLLITIAIVWIYGHLLTVGSAYKHRPEHTQFNCRTDRPTCFPCRSE